MNPKRKELQAVLNGQEFGCNRFLSVLDYHCKQAQAYASTSNAIAVLSDFITSHCYIYSGLFGHILGLPEFSQADSSFEDNIFDCIPDEELLKRHILELRYYKFQKDRPVADRQNYMMLSLVHFRLHDGSMVPVLHRTYYLESDPTGNIWLGLCTYEPFLSLASADDGHIINLRTGLVVDQTEYQSYDNKILSERQIQVLALLSQGLSSKEIADRLHISINTVSRHRQDILAQLQVPNTAKAVEIALRMHII